MLGSRLTAGNTKTTHSPYLEFSAFLVYLLFHFSPRTGVSGCKNELVCVYLVCILHDFSVPVKMLSSQFSSLQRAKL